MLRKTLKCVATLACAFLVLAGPSAGADDKKDDKPALSGVWMQTGGQVKIEFSGKDVLKIAPHGKDDVIVIVCKYALEKEGVVKATITDFEGKEELKEKAKEKLPVGTEFRFKWQVKDATAMLDDLKGDQVELLKSHLEGKFDKK